MSKKFRLYPENMLPNGFSYPEQIKIFSLSGDYPSLGPWWFVDADSEAGHLFYKIREHDGRNLVPFAKVDDGRGDIACFDGDNVGGDPEVLMLVLDESERRYSFANFADWMRAAMADAGR